jgi:LDH2 family malate/lactate/ureidoglycolate dehydrogenase
MTLAIAKAQTSGIAVVVATQSGHIGRLADYVEMAADAGLIGVAMLSLSSASIPAYGGMSGVAGTNPMAYAIPRRNGQHFLLDFATAALSRGELGRRAALGEAIPEVSCWILRGSQPPYTGARHRAVSYRFVPTGESGL